MLSHKQILRYLWKNKEILKEALGLPYIWVRDTEYVIDNETQEKVDMVFQDMFDPHRGLREATCFALELKRDKGDHEVLGQLKKYVEVLEKISKYGHWGKVQGIALAQEYTKTGKKLLWDEGYRTFTYFVTESNDIKIREEKSIVRQAVI
jgi:RecB family endonuclease NucS